MGGAIVSDFDLMIANAVEEMENSSECVAEACKKTLMDYRSLKSIEGMDAPHLRMIAWDRS